jgi:hypothetical protein
MALAGAIIRSRTAQANNDDSESRKWRTDDSVKPLFQRMINARVIFRSVIALIDKTPKAVGTKRGARHPPCRSWQTPNASARRGKPL